MLYLFTVWFYICRICHVLELQMLCFLGGFIMAPLPLEPCLCLTITVSFEAVSYLNTFKSEGMEALLQAVRDFVTDEVCQFYDKVPRNMCYASLIPTPHPTGRQLLLTIGGCEHPSDDVDVLLRVRENLQDFLRKQLVAFVTRKGGVPNTDVFCGIQVWGTLNLVEK